MSKIDQAKSISTKLSKISKATGIPYQNIATSFLIERLLARLLTNLQLTKTLVFKGGYVGLRVYDTPRYTIDLDALLMKADIPSTMKLTPRPLNQISKMALGLNWNHRLILKPKVSMGAFDRSSEQDSAKNQKTSNAHRSLILIWGLETRSLRAQ